MLQKARGFPLRRYSPPVVSPGPALPPGRRVRRAAPGGPAPQEPEESGKAGTKRKVLVCQCVGHNKGCQLPFETQRESPEGSAETVPMRPYICNPLRAPPSPVPFAPLAAQPCFSNNDHRTQLISFSPPSFSRSLLSQEPETHCCEAGAGWEGHARTPAAGGPSAGSRCSCEVVRDTCVRSTTGEADKERALVLQYPHRYPWIHTGHEHVLLPTAHRHRLHRKGHALQMCMQQSLSRYSPIAIVRLYHKFEVYTHFVLYK